MRLNVRDFHAKVFKVSTLLLAASGVHCFIVNASQQIVHPFHTESMALLKYFSQCSTFLLDLNEPLLVKVKPEVIDNATSPGMCYSC